MKTIASALVLAFAFVLFAPAPAFAASGRKPGVVRQALANLNVRVADTLDRHAGKTAVLFTATSGTAFVTALSSPSPVVRWSAGGVALATGLVAAGSGVVKLINVVQQRGN